jgi:acetyl esterase/lipase
MDRNRRALLAAGLTLAAGAAVTTDDSRADPPSTPVEGGLDAPIWPPPERLSLWPGAPPGSPETLPAPSLTMNGPRGERLLHVSGIAHPEINVFRAPRPDGSALLVFPGGAYRFVSVQNEGLDVARRYTPFGTSVFVLTYRLPGEGWRRRDRVPLQDAQRAMRLLRRNAARFALDTGRIGVLGFSAGGHLAADLITAFDERCTEPVDEADSLSARPDFAGLAYAVTSLQSRISHGESREQLLGAGATPALIARRSPAEHVRSDTPPCFIMHAMDDDAVPVEASLEMIAACRRARVPVEGHLFEAGRHGFGLHPAPNLPAAHWPDLFAAWMDQRRDLVT